MSNEEKTDPATWIGEFEYRVSVGFALPLEHAEVLHECASLHYDAVVKGSAQRGAINGLRNVARWQTNPADERPHPLSVTFGDLDTALKAMERPLARHSAVIVHEIREGIRDAMDAISARTRELYGTVSCDDVEAFAAGDLGDRDDAFREHLKTCEQCGTEFIESVQLTERVSQLDKPVSS